MAELRGRRPGRLACWRAAEGSCEVAWPCSRVRRLQDKGVRKRRKERKEGRADSAGLARLVREYPRGR